MPMEDEEQHDMARSFGSMDTMTIRQDQSSGINRTKNGDPTFRKWSLVDPSLRKLDSIDISGSHSTTEQDATAIHPRQDDTMDCGTRKRDALGLNLTVAVQEEGSCETNDQVGQIVI